MKSWPVSSWKWFFFNLPERCQGADVKPASKVLVSTALMGGSAAPRTAWALEPSGLGGVTASITRELRVPMLLDFSDPQFIRL